MLKVEDLWDRIDAQVVEREAARLPLAVARGCVLKERVLADMDMPAFDRSAMDGFAVAAAAGAGRFRLAGEIRPGGAAPARVELGEAWRIYTGAEVPEGAGIVMVEESEEAGEKILLKVPPSRKFVRLRGSQSVQGETLLRAGQVVTPGAAALLATVGVAQPLVVPRVRVAHVASGSELVGIDQQPSLGQIRDSNSTLIQMLVEEAGHEVVFQARTQEDLSEIMARLDQAPAWDLLLISGGASVGDHDHTAELFVKLGFEIHASKVRSRPGKPLIFATKAGQAAFGLPGNPLSHFVCFHVFVRRALDRFAGRGAASPVNATLHGRVPEADARDTWWPVRVSVEDGGYIAEVLDWVDSSDLTALGLCGGLLRIPPEGIAGEAQIWLTSGAYL